MKTVLWGFALVVAGILGGLIAVLLVRGAPGLTIGFLFEMSSRAGREGGLLPVLVSTGLLVGGALLLAVPLGVGAALYLQEYAPDPQGSLAGTVRVLIEALAGVPSILFGLFGFSLFVIRLGWGWSIAAGSATLCLMLLPTLIRTAEEAMLAVPREAREGALSLGATRWETVRWIVLPGAAPGILTGVILGLGRALGETAAVLLTAGSDLHIPTSVADPGRSLAVHLYLLATEGLSDGRAYTTALVLVLTVLSVNMIANLALERGRH